MDLVKVLVCLSMVGEYHILFQKW